MNEIWTMIEPYVMGVLGTLGGGTIIYILARVLIGKLINKASKAYDVSQLADAVTDKLAGKTINIDVTAVTERKLEKINKGLSDKVQSITAELNAQKLLLARIGDAVAHFKALSDDELTRLRDAIKAVDCDYTPPEPPEPIATVKLEPIALEQTTSDKLGDTVNLE